MSSGFETVADAPSSTTEGLRRESMLAKIADLDAQHAVARGRWRRTLRQPAPRPRQADAARAHRAADRPRQRVPGTVPARRLGLGLHRRRERGHRHRRDRGRRVHDHRQRPLGEGRRLEPVDRQEDLPGLPDRRGEPATDRRARRVRRRRPADAEGDLHPGRQAVPRHHPIERREGPHDRAGLRQLDGRRRLRAGHERLHRDGQGTGEGVPRRPAPGEDGHRRGVGRRVARWRGDARAYVGPRGLPRGRRVRRPADRTPDRGAAEPAAALFGG